MAHNRDYKPEDIAFPNQIIKKTDLVSSILISNVAISYPIACVHIEVGGGSQRW